MSHRIGGKSTELRALFRTWVTLYSVRMGLRGASGSLRRNPSNPATGPGSFAHSERSLEGDLDEQNEVKDDVTAAIVQVSAAMHLVYARAQHRMGPATTFSARTSGSAIDSAT